MRVPIAHTLPKEEVRRRLRERSHEIANFIPGGMADVTTGWPNEDRMDLSVRAMGQGIDGRVLIEDDTYHGEKGHGAYLRRGLSTYLQ